MTSVTKAIRIATSCLTLACAAASLHLAVTAARAQQQLGLLTVTGSVKINGRPAATGDIVAKGSEVQTGNESSADVDLGELGRVEVLPSTILKLRYDEISTTHTSASVAILLGDGSVRASNREEIVFNIESGMTLTRPTSRNQQNVFTVDAACGITSVSVAKGRVELRAGDRGKQIEAGGRDSVGQARPGCTPAR